MKKIKIILLTTLILFSALCTAAMAQSNATTTASANVISAINVGEESQPLDFGYILPGTEKFINQYNQAVEENGDGIIGGEQRGYVSIEAATGNNIDVSLDVPSALATDDNNNTLIINFSIGAWSGSGNDFVNAQISETKPDGTAAAGEVTGGDNLDFSSADGGWSLSSPFAMPSSGKVYLAVGAFVTATEKQATGNYSGTIEVTATVAN